MLSVFHHRRDHQEVSSLVSNEPSGTKRRRKTSKSSCLEEKGDERETEQERGRGEPRRMQNRNVRREENGDQKEDRKSWPRSNVESTQWSSTRTTWIGLGFNLVAGQWIFKNLPLSSSISACTGMSFASDVWLDSCSLGSDHAPFRWLVVLLFARFILFGWTVHFNDIMLANGWNPPTRTKQILITPIESTCAVSYLAGFRDHIPNACCVC